MTAVLTESAAALWKQPFGVKQRYALRVGTRVDVPVVVVTGATAGPRAALVAGVHGDEVEGQVALLEFAEQLEPAAVRGAVVMVLCANPLAAEKGQRCTPTDGEDLNRVFPGDPAGGVSQVLAAALFELVREADVLLTLHSWYATGEVLPYVEYAAGNAPAALAGRAIARACGLEWIMPLEWHRGLLPAAAARHGIAAIEAEIGGLGQITRTGQELCRRTILRFLRHAGVVQGEQETPAKIEAVRGHHLYAPTTGILHLHVALGEMIQGGQRLASVTGFDGQVSAELVAPTDGRVGAVRRFAPVTAGDHVAAIFASVDNEAELGRGSTNIPGD